MWSCLSIKKQSLIETHFELVLLENKVSQMSVSRDLAVVYILTRVRFIISRLVSMYVVET